MMLLQYRRRMTVTIVIHHSQTATTRHQMYEGSCVQHTVHHVWLTARCGTAPCLYITCVGYFTSHRLSLGALCARRSLFSGRTYVRSLAPSACRSGINPAAADSSSTHGDTAVASQRRQQQGLRSGGRMCRRRVRWLARWELHGPHASRPPSAPVRKSHDAVPAISPVRNKAKRAEGVIAAECSLANYSMQTHRRRRVWKPLLTHPLYAICVQDQAQCSPRRCPGAAGP